MLYVEALKRSSCFQKKVTVQFIEIRVLNTEAQVHVKRYQSREYASSNSNMFYSKVCWLHFVTWYLFISLPVCSLHVVLLILSSLVIKPHLCLQVRPLKLCPLPLFCFLSLSTPSCEQLLLCSKLLLSNFSLFPFHCLPDASQLLTAIWGVF